MASRFVTRSFFVGPVEQKHVDKVVKAFGGPKLKAGYRQFSSKTLEIEERYIYIYMRMWGAHASGV